VTINKIFKAENLIQRQLIAPRPETGVGTPVLDAAVPIGAERLKTGVSKTGECESFPKRGESYLF